MNDISKFTGVSYSALKYLVQDFLRANLITQTRIVGRSKMYKLDIGNVVVEKFIDFYWAVIESNIPKEKIDGLNESRVAATAVN